MSRVNISALKMRLQQLQSEVRRKQAEAINRQRQARLRLQQIESELRRLKLR